MKKIFLSSITLFLFVILSNGILHAETKNPLKELEKVLGKTFKTLSGKKLNKKNTKKFILNFAITLKDERNDGLVTYVFTEREYSRYKDFKIISTDGWRFTNTGSLRIFDADIKLTWKIKLDKNVSKKNVINIKAKYDPIGKLYGFTYKPIDEFLNDLDEHEKKIKREKIEKQKKIDEEKKRLEKEKLDAQKKSDEEKKRLEKEKLDAQKKSDEEKKLLEKEKLEVQKKAEEEKLNLQKEFVKQKRKHDEEKLKLQKEFVEQKRKHDEEKLKLQNELDEQKRKHDEEKLKLQKEFEEQIIRREEEKLKLQKELEEERLYIQLEPKFRRKCEKRLYNNLYKINTPEYRACILNKGP